MRSNNGNNGKKIQDLTHKSEGKQCSLYSLFCAVLSWAPSSDSLMQLRDRKGERDEKKKERIMSMMNGKMIISIATK